MKNNLRRLTWILNLLPIENIYTSNITKSEVNVQCYYDSEISKALKKLKFTFSIDANGYAEFKRGNYTVIMTERAWIS